MQRLIGGSVVGCLVLIAVGCGQNRFQQEVETETSAVNLAREMQQGDYDLITTDELKELLDGGTEFLLIDTMPYEESYRRQHIAGARNFPFPIEEMPEWDDTQTAGKSVGDFEQLLGEDEDRLIVVYCGFVACTRSHNAAMWARQLGYTNVKRHPGGIFAWKGAGYPTVSVASAGE